MSLAFPRRLLLRAAATAATLGVASPGRAADPPLRLDFEDTPAGALPHGFTVGLTGSGAPPTWRVIEDPSAPAGSKVLAQTSADRTDYRFPLAMLDVAQPADVDVTVMFKPVAGEVDRAAGIAVRLKDTGTYYVVRANALEDNVRLYRVIGGQRIQFAGTSVKVPTGVWQELRLRVQAARFEVFLAGRSLYAASDTSIAGGGRVALWTKADSVTYFDDLLIKPAT